ncbi:hypothetical protein ACQJBY_022332 [Aegilops geniculata]
MASCSGHSPSRRLRAREPVQQLACVVAILLEPSPPPSPSAPPSALVAVPHGKPVADRALIVPWLLPPLFPELCSSLCTAVLLHLSLAFPELMRVHTRPRRRSHVRGNASAARPRPGYLRPPEPLLYSASASPHSQLPPQSVSRAGGPLPAAHRRHGRRRALLKSEQPRAPPLLLPPPVEHHHSSDHPHALFPSPEPLWPRVPSPPEAPSAGVLAALNPALLEVRSVLERVGLVALSTWVGRAPPTVARVAGDCRRGGRPRLCLSARRAEYVFPARKRNFVRFQLKMRFPVLKAYCLKYVFCFSAQGLVCRDIFIDWSLNFVGL